MGTIIDIATFNLKSSLFGMGIHKWKRRRALVLRMMRELGSDIIGVQELTPLMRRDFENELHEYNLVGLGRGGGFLDEHSDIAVKNGLGVSYDGTFWLAKKNHRLFSPMSPLAWIFPRICTVAEVKVGERRVRVFNTHLDVSSEAARCAQLRLICRQISERQKKEPLPTLLMGDFNTKPGAKSLRLLADGYGFDNVKLIGIAEGEAGGTFHFYKGGMGSRRIDYIFATPEFSLISAKIVRTSYDGEYPSDHYPLSVRLALD